MNVLHELFTKHCYMVLPEYAQSVRKAIQSGIANNEPARITDEKVLGFKLVMLNGKLVKMSSADFDSRQMNANEDDDNEPPFISVYNITGGITRDGGGCSYGSKDHRDMMIDAAKQPNCLGHIFIIDTPGGSAWAKNDYQQAIDFAHSKGQSVMALIDGDCCSAGMYLAALCDNRYYVNDKDTIGCIGVLACFYTQKDGEKCEYTGETYHEIYDPESFNKNQEIRDIANNNDEKLLIEELTALGVEFRDTVKAHCPNVTDDQLHGKTFDAVDVKGSLMDDKKTFNEVCQIIIDKSNSKSNPKGPNANSKQNNITNSKNQKDMNKKYEKVAELCGAELQFKDGGTFLNETLLDAMDANIATLQAASAERDSLTKQVAELQAQLAEKTKAGDTECAEATKKVDALNATIKEHETKITELNTNIEQKDAKIKELDEKVAEGVQQAADLTKKIENLSTDPGKAPEVGAAQSNGTSAETPKMAVGMPAWDDSKSATENYKIIADYKKKQNAKINSKTER